MKYRRTIIILILLITASTAAVAGEIKERPLRQAFYREQMILFGLYIYGIEQALSDPFPDLDELHFLANSIESVAKEIKTTKEDQPYHDNMQTLYARTGALKRAKTLEQARSRGRALIESCANCHRTQLPVSGRW